MVQIEPWLAWWCLASLFVSTRGAALRLLDFMKQVRATITLFEICILIAVFIILTIPQAALTVVMVRWAFL